MEADEENFSYSFMGLGVFYWKVYSSECKPKKFRTDSGYHLDGLFWGAHF
jgi:hypothetical protein